MTLESHSQGMRRITCHRHPTEPVTGFCASCLRDRLAFLESSATGCEGHAASGGCGDPSSSLSGELRRCKSYSASKCGAFSRAREPSRKSCDVRARNTLSQLFCRDDEENDRNKVSKVESKNLGFSGVTNSAFEPRELTKKGGNARESEDAFGLIINDDEQIVEEELKSMKEHIELEWQRRKQAGRDLKDIAGSFWMAASVFSQKLRKWSQKQRMKNHSDGCGNRTGNGRADQHLSPAEKISVRPLRETQSEVGDYGFGRRSCDTDPRFSVDVGRMSLDDPRCSFDEHRASWDGYMIARTIPRLAPMLSVIEDAMLAPISRLDNRTSAEVHRESINEDDTACCSDSSSSQVRNSFDCSSSSKSSHKKTTEAEVDEIKSMSNAKVSPTTVHAFTGSKLFYTERSMGGSHMNHLKFDHSENHKAASWGANGVVGSGNINRFMKHGRWRKWQNFMGFIQRLGDNNSRYGDVEDLIGFPLENISSRNQGGDASGIGTGDAYQKLTRCGSCASSRSSGNMIGSYHFSSTVAAGKGVVKKSGEESVLERNHSSKQSHGNLDNGLLRFHLTPQWGSRRTKSGKKLMNSPSIARNVL